MSQQPIYLDERGEPQQATPVYLDEQGNPVAQPDMMASHGTEPRTWLQRVVGDPGGRGLSPEAQAAGEAVNEGGPMGAALEGALQVLAGPVAGLALKGTGVLGRRLYQGALKPSKAIASKVPGGERALAETGLREGLTVSGGGLRKAEDLISGLDDQVSSAIAGSSATVPRAQVMRTLKGPVSEFKDQVAPLGDLRRIANVGQEFKRTTPEMIPVQRAQKMKQGTYRAQAKKYGQQGGAEVEAEKALARGLKEGVAEAVPEVAPLNARQSSLIPVKRALEDAMRRSGNRDAIGLTDVIAAGTKPSMLAATLAMRAPVQSMAGRAAYRTGQSVNPDALAAALRALMLGSQEE